MLFSGERQSQLHIDVQTEDRSRYASSGWYPRQWPADRENAIGTGWQRTCILLMTFHPSSTPRMGMYLDSLGNSSWSNTSNVPFSYLIACRVISRVGTRARAVRLFFVFATQNVTAGQLRSAASGRCRSQHDVTTRVQRVHKRRGRQLLPRHYTHTHTTTYRTRRYARDDRRQAIKTQLPAVAVFATILFRFSLVFVIDHNIVVEFYLLYFLLQLILYFRRSVRTVLVCTTHKRNVAARQWWCARVCVCVCFVLS